LSAGSPPPLAAEVVAGLVLVECVDPGLVGDSVTEAKHQVEGGFLLDVVAGVGLDVAPDERVLLREHHGVARA